MAKFIPAGPKRFAHQTRGLRKLLENGGSGALLFDPGLGKTATAFDFISILGLKIPPVDGVQEVRILVVCPLAAVDTWVKQAKLYVHEDLNYWAEALGGTLRQRSEALASRGGARLSTKKLRRKINGVMMDAPIRSEHSDKSIDVGFRSSRPSMIISDGPDGLGKDKPRVILEVLNFDTFGSRQSVGSRTMADVMLDGVKRFQPHLLIIDESHKIKGAGSNVSRLMDRVAQHIKRKQLLTGTVMPAGPIDVFAQWRVLDPYAFGEMQPDGSVKRATLDSFKRRFAVMGGYMGHEVIGYRNLDELQQIMGRLASVAKKEDSLDLPEVTYVVVPVMLSSTEKRVYEDLKKNLATQLTGGVLATAPNRLALMMRLRQVTAGHLPDDLGNVQVIGDSKAKVIDSIANDTLIGEDRIVVFTLFTHELHSLVEKLARPGTIIMAISGETPQSERLRMRARFGSDEKVRMILIANVKTISLAVNELVTASNVIFGSLSQQRDDLIQAIDRLNRLGQKKPVTVWFAEAEGTIDTVIHASHDDRTKLETAVLKHILGEDFSMIDGTTSMPLEAIESAIGVYDNGGDPDGQ